MLTGTRACVAYACARLVSGRSTSAVFDYSQSKHVLISGTVNDRSVNVYDHDRECFMTGSRSGSGYSPIRLRC